jgi:hypothetical protein
MAPFCSARIDTIPIVGLAALSMLSNKEKVARVGLLA